MGISRDDFNGCLLTPGFHGYLHRPQAFGREPCLIDVHQPLQHEGCRRNSLPSIPIRCMITANLRATATRAFLLPLRRARRARLANRFSQSFRC